MEEPRWTNVFTTNQSFEAEMLKGCLLSEGIECIALDKRDSAYLFGEIELLVPASDVIRAKQIIASLETK